MAGVSAKEMADHFGYTKRQNVTTRRRNMGLPPRRRGNSGRHGGWPTITIAEFFEMEIGRRMKERIQ